MNRYAALAAVLVMMVGCGDRDLRADQAESEQSIRFVERAGVVAGEGISVHHDEKRQVTCWALRQGGGVGGLSCIPDHMLDPKPDQKDSQP